MTQPTQELPPWLSASTVVVTNPGGSAVTTTTVVRLPLTYYGPSVSCLPHADAFDDLYNLKRDCV
jgi:UDP-N-acetylglucosamine:LPS N-acetylglucosamine transferase